MPGVSGGVAEGYHGVSEDYDSAAEGYHGVPEDYDAAAEGYHGAPEDYDAAVVQEVYGFLA